MRQIVSEHQMTSLARNFFRKGIGFAFFPIQGTDMFIMLTYECESHPNHAQQFEMRNNMLTGELVCEKCLAETRRNRKSVQALSGFKRGSGVQPLLVGDP